ncbi:ABC transporter ATP-binding protein [Candidatus Zixiibacteriota bacterium]
MHNSNHSQTVIEVRDLVKRFAAHVVLGGINLEARKGETLVIIGRSGCGKSVLLKHIIGLLWPDEGTVAVEGHVLSQMKSRELYQVRLRFGMLFQNAALFDSMTVAENVGLALSEHTRKKPAEMAEIIAHKLELVGMSGTERMMPADLSGGMKKRVSLARAIAFDPDYILFDEPTTGLDPITADAINDLIVELGDRLAVTSIAVTHDMRSAYKIADRIIMLHDGKIIKSGTPEEIQHSDDPVIHQFINGLAEGPLRAI